MIKTSALIETTKASKEVYKGKLLHVFYDEAILPDGEVSGREWIKHPGACAIVPVFENGDIMMINQFRYPMKQIFLEVPAGKIDPNENPFDTAKRELVEETGISAKEFHYVGHFYPAIGYADEIIHIFAATGLLEGVKEADKDEFLMNERISFNHAIELIHKGEITDGKTISSLTRVYNWYRKEWA